MASQHARRLDRAVEAFEAIKDPLDRLEAARSARERFEQLEREQVAALRRAGTTWSRIGALYGLTKQGAQQRFRDPTGPKDSAGAKGARDAKA